MTKIYSVQANSDELDFMEGLDFSGGKKRKSRRNKKRKSKKVKKSKK